MTDEKIPRSPFATDNLLRLENAVVLLGCALVGYGLWATAPVVVGTAQPWDAAWPYYPAVLIVTAAALRLATSADYLAIFFGLWIGQFIAILGLYSPRFWGGPVFQASIGTVSTGVGSLISVAGYLAGSFVATRRPRRP